MLLMLGLACGVNTGNPGGKARPPIVEDDQKTQTTVNLSLRPFAEGTIRFQAAELRFLPKGAQLTDASVLVIPLSQAVEISTGAVTQLLKSYELKEGTYDRLLVTLQEASEVTLTDASQNKEKIGLAPLRYYPDATLEDKSGVVRILFDLGEDTVTVVKGKAQSIVLRSDFKANFKPYAEINPITKAYFESQGLSTLRYTLFPETPTRPVVTEIPAGTDPEDVILEFNLEIPLQSPDPDLETVEVCLYEGAKTQAQLAEDYCATEYFDYEIVEAEREGETGPGRYVSRFLLESGDYTIAVFRDTPVYGLMGYKTVRVEANKLLVLPQMNLPLEPLVEQEE
jgi:hypothetical protein